MLVCEILNYDFWSVSRICQASVDTLFTPLPFIGCRTNAFGGGWEGGGGEHNGLNPNGQWICSLIIFTTCDIRSHNNNSTLTMFYSFRIREFVNDNSYDILMVVTYF